MANRLAATLLLALLVGPAWADDAPPPSPEGVLETAARRVEVGDLAAASAALATLDGVDVPAPLRAQADLLLGLALVRQGKPEAAVSYLERAADGHALLGDYALYALAQAQRGADRRDRAAAALRRLTAQHPQSLFVERAGRELPRDLLTGGDLTQAEEAAQRYLASSAATAAGRAEARLVLAEAALRAGRADDAAEGLRRLWLEMPGSPESQRAKDLLADLPGAKPFTAEEQFQRAALLSQLGRHGQALPELRPFAEAGGARETQARLLLGIGAFNLRLYTQAVRWLDPLRDLTGPERLEALYWLGRSAGRAGDPATFDASLRLLADLARETRRGEESLYLLAQAAMDDADYATAIVLAKRLLQEYPQGAWRDTGLWLLGWSAYKLRSHRVAAEAWGRLITEEPGSRWRGAALYWRGRALEALHQPGEAGKSYRTLLDTAPDQYYYRMRATERLAALAKKRPAAAPTPVGPLAASGPAPTGLHAEKARALRRLGLLEEAADEWSEQVRVRPEDRGLLAHACAGFLDLSRYDRALWLTSRYLRPLLVQQGGQLPVRNYWHCAYPLGYADVVRREARARSLDPHLVLAVIREESAFAPRAVSRAGARGLMQLMPQTADLVSRQHRLPAVAGRLEVPQVNIQLGVLHLADLVAEEGGIISLAVAAYNAGKPPVRRWLERYGFSDEVEFLEDIPYNETRNYVKRVLANQERYRSLYGLAEGESRKPAPGADPAAKGAP